ncbi:hypothetical protein UFOVP1313_45 [uncultured Caudovirales phage]|uniref:Uncharacterized protein n=1 Tax=uncultured Caudovirales phage TaxID=2100421 RepID=A0A6J5RKL2_9CAUD|nr:hypothetical protein UFOVP1313_45 [uncultured Caudovirales phage]
MTGPRFDQTNEEWQAEMREREIREKNYETWERAKKLMEMPLASRHRPSDNPTELVWPCRGDYCTVNGEAKGLALVTEVQCGYCQMVDGLLAEGGKQDGKA